MIERATSSPNEVLVAGELEDGTPHNVLLRDHAALRAQLIETPRMIPNPAFAPLEAQAFDDAIAQFDRERAGE